MELPIKQWGNTAAIRLPAPLLKKLKVSVGDAFIADFKGSALVLKPITETEDKRRQDLLAVLKEAPEDAPKEWLAKVANLLRELEGP